MKASRNDPCPCGSGKKYRACCMPRDVARARATRTLGADAVADTEARVSEAAQLAPFWEADVVPLTGGAFTGTGTHTDSAPHRRVFVTGGTGYIGRAVAEAFRREGHAVTVMVRGEAAAARLRAAGFEAVIADLRRPATYRHHAAAHDVVVHAAFEYDDDGNEVVQTEETAVEALLAACADAAAPRQLVYTSNAFLLGGMGTDPVDEDAPIDEARYAALPRLRLERRVLDAGTETLRTAAVRVGSVYGGTGGTYPWLFALARADGWMPVWGTGENRWPLVYLDDLAELYLRIAARHASGVFHGADGVPMTVAEVVRAAAAAAGCEVRQVPAEGVRDTLLRDVAVLPARSRSLGWAPRFPSFREGAETAFREWQAAES